MSKTRELYPLSTKKIIKKTLSSTIGWVIILVIILSFAGLIKLESGGLGAIIGSAVAILVFFIVCIFILTYLYQRWYFAVYFYDLTADYIIIKKGPITPREITIPYERVQDVYVDQDLLDRIFGLYDVHLSSATVSSGMEAHIDGVEKAAADGLRAVLLQTVQQRIGRK